MKIWVRRSDSPEDSAIGIERSALSGAEDPDVSDLLIKCCEVIFVGQCLPSEVFLSLGTSSPLKPVSNRKSVTDLIALAEKDAKKKKRDETKTQEENGKEEDDDEDEEEELKAFVICPRSGSEERFNATVSSTAAVVADLISPIKQTVAKATTNSSSTTSGGRKSFLPAAARRSTSTTSDSGNNNNRYNSPKALQNIPKTTRLARSSSPIITNQKKPVANKAAPKPAWVERLNAGKNSGSARRNRSASPNTSTNLPPLHQASPVKTSSSSPTSVKRKASPALNTSNNNDKKTLWGYSHLNSARKSPSGKINNAASSTPDKSNTSTVNRSGRSVTPLLNRSNNNNNNNKSSSVRNASNSSIRSREVEAELDKSTQNVAPHKQAHARSSLLHRRASADRSHHNFTHQKHPLRENRSLVQKREQIQEESREEMLQHHHSDPRFAQGIHDSRIRSSSNSKNTSRSGSQAPQNQNESENNNSTTKTYHHVICEKFVPTWGLPRVCNRCKGQRRDHPDASKNTSLTLMQRRNMARKPASAFSTNGRIHATSHTDPNESVTISSSSTIPPNNNNSHNNNTSMNKNQAAPPVTPQQQIYSTRMNMSDVVNTSNNTNQHHNNSTTASSSTRNSPPPSSPHEQEHEEEDQEHNETSAVDTVASESTDEEEQEDTSEKKVVVVVAENENNKEEEKEIVSESHQENDQSSSASNTNLVAVATGSNGGNSVMGNFARVSAALVNDDEHEDSHVDKKENGVEDEDKKESVMSESSPEKYHVGDDDDDDDLHEDKSSAKNTSEGDEDKKDQEKQTREKNLAHFAEF